MAPYTIIINYIYIYVNLLLLSTKSDISSYYHCALGSHESEAFLVKALAKNPMNDSYFPVENPASHCLSPHRQIFCWSCKLVPQNRSEKKTWKTFSFWIGCFWSNMYNVMGNWPRENNYWIKFMPIWYEKWTLAPTEQFISISILWI